MSPETSVNETSPLGAGEGVGLVLAAQDDGNWKPVAEWLARHPEHAAEIDTFLRRDGRIPERLSAGRSFSDLSGTTVGVFELYEPLGKGGAGVVFRGFDSKLKRDVAVKLIHTGDPERFRVEAERVAGLEHANIVPVFAFGETDRGPYLVMPLMPGGTLEDYRKARPNGRLPAEEAARLVRDIARGVHYAHQRGLIHRDLKPLNVLLDEKGTPRIADFGLARPIDGPDSIGIAGTVAYMAPEQARGDKGLTTAVDVHALGATLFELLTGRLPFGGGLSALQRVIADAPPPARLFAPDVPADLEAICLKCMEKQLASRYATALEVAKELDRFLRGEAVRARPPGFWDWLRQLARTRPERQAYSWQVVHWFGAIVLATNVAIYALIQIEAPAIGVWAANGACSLAMLVVLWWYMLSRFRQLPVTERHSLVLAAGHIFAYLPLMLAYVPFSLTAPARDALGLYPPMAALSGLGLFVLGSTNWSRFFLVGLAVMFLTPVLARWPDVSPLVFGGVVAVVMWYWGFVKAGNFDERSATK